jgi:hypothetical protein
LDAPRHVRYVGDVVHYVGEAAKEVVEVEVDSLHALVAKTISIVPS